MNSSSSISAASIARREFHLVKEEYGPNTITCALERKQITASDAALISEFIAELRSTRNIGTGRANKITYALVHWRRWIGEYATNAVGELYTGISRLKAAEFRANKYKQNPLRDYVLFLKRFYRWLIENGYSSIPLIKVQII